MVILTFFFFVFGSSLELEHFAGKDVRIYLSTANHIFLAKDTRDGHILPKSKYSNLEAIFTTFRILRDGQEYRLFSGNEMLCAELGTVDKCESSKTWKLTPKAMGYTISQEGRCITIVSRTRIGINQCTDSDDQLFDFRLANEDQSCGEEKKPEDPKQEPKTIVINVSTSDLVDTNTNKVSNHLLHHCEDSSDSHSTDHHYGVHRLRGMLNGSRHHSTLQKVVYL